MRGALLGSEGVCQPACKCVWKSQPSLGSLPRVIPTSPQRVFWSTAAPEKAPLTFRAVKMPCVHTSLHSVLLCCCWLGKNTGPSVVYRRERRTVRGQAVRGALGNIYLGQTSPAHGQCAQRVEAISFDFSNTAFPKQPMELKDTGK